ncbi:hypothetical protein BJX62DRAFT_203042 [Aspergillus germanicus]
MRWVHVAWELLEELNPVIGVETSGIMLRYRTKDLLNHAMTLCISGILAYQTSKLFFPDALSLL